MDSNGSAPSGAGHGGKGILDLIVPKKKGRTVLLKGRVLIPEYLRKAMCNAVATSGGGYVEGASALSDRQEDHAAPSSPLIVFVNSKSGGRLGPALAGHLRDLISPEQVFDLNETKPTDFVRHGLGCLDALAENGDQCARLTRERLRILVAGGDGTVGWVLGSLAELHLEHRGPCPPVGVIPLGTGNDLARSFGWGASFTSKGRAAVKDWLLKATDGSTPQPLDCWKVSIRTSTEKPIKWPHALKPQQHIPLSTEGEQDEYSASFEGVFYNYFSLGMDAQVAYGFHELRNRMPWLARGPIANKMIYSGYSCWQGWFCTSLSTNPRARGVSTVLRLSVRKKHGDDGWEEVDVPSSVRAVVILNLQSYAGGRNPWGHPKPENMQKKGFVEAKPNDGYLEIFGLRDGWHTSLVMVSLLKAVRLAQAQAIRLELHGEKRDRAYMQLDGEPWKHPLDPNGKPVIVEIGRVSIPSTMLKAT
ncbi:diacylglycerol kinase 7 [Selaginella moellendorffii]|uniref:diacylglycerol kinase 7 n=1 Tax=Selaginella moellendorffii TaxID=88036 RepID=UPI000D1C732D|nr:diacylglycerol kinase 7 [Selaginella moellendorffii]|eukprot:XP_024537974.1 diacylglycerol kinase 7 [Selaginella moellendorffii]